MRRSLFVSLLLAVSCLRANVDLDNRFCSDGDCADGYVCNPLTSECIPPLSLACDGTGDVCPTDLADGDTCGTVGTFVPCAAGTSGCESGCRLCDPDHTWSECSCTGTNCACFPSNGGVEVCDGFDNDCHGGVDDGDNVEGCIDSWIDADHDGFGTGASICVCGVPAGRAPLDGDPDDSNPAVNPDAGELCDGIDNNGDGSTLAREQDNDGDHYVECPNWVGTVSGVIGGGDCNDVNKNIHPGAAEVCDGVDNSCGGLHSEETDKDGDGYVVCSPWSGTTAGIIGGGDCDPSNSAVHPFKTEVRDGIDNDCDTAVDECLINCTCGDQLVSCYQLEALPISRDEGPARIDVTVESGNGVTATGVVGNGYAIAASYHVEGDNADSHDLSRFSLSVWVKPISNPTGSAIRYILDIQSQIFLVQEKQGDVSCTYLDQSGNAVRVAANSVLTSNVFTHLGCSYGGAQLRLFVDGSNVSSTSTSSPIEDSNSGPMRIGSNSPEGSDTNLQSFLGVIDQVKIFGSAIGDVRMCAEAFGTSCGP